MSYALVPGKAVGDLHGTNGLRGDRLFGSNMEKHGEFSKHLDVYMMFTMVYPCVPENMECRCCLPFVWVKDLLTNIDRETGGPKKGFAKAKSKVVQGTWPLSRRFPRIHRCKGSFTKMHICMEIYVSVQPSKWNIGKVDAF